MDSFLLPAVFLVLGAAVYFMFFRESRLGQTSDVEPPMEPLAPRDWVEAELAEFNGRDGKSIYFAGAWVSVNGVLALNLLRMGCSIINFNVSHQLLYIHCS